MNIYLYIYIYIYIYIGCAISHFTLLKINQAKTREDRNVQLIANERGSFGVFILI